jgi:hypothetical protein
MNTYFSKEFHFEQEWLRILRWRHPHLCPSTSPFSFQKFVEPNERIDGTFAQFVGLCKINQSPIL